MTIHGPGVAASVAGTAVGTVIAMSYTSGEVLLILAAVGTLVTIVGGQIVAIIVTINARKEVSKKVDENTAVTTAVAEKTASIEHATNSAATKAEEIIAALRQQITNQHSAAADAKQIAAVLAQSAKEIALAHGSPQQTLAGAVPAAEHSLKQIDTNTAETAKNTARTDETVQELKDKP